MTFGPTSAFEPAMALFAERFSLAFRPFGVTNASPAAGDDDLRGDSFRAAARAHNDLDIRLYRSAMELFEQRVASYTDALLGLPLADGRLEWSLRGCADGALVLRQGALAAKLGGWVLVDGRAADAVLVRSDAGTTAAFSRVVSEAPLRLTRNVENRYAGISATVPVSASADSIVLIGFDRTRGVRAEQRIALVRSG
jgi:hypothetical protein